MGGISQEDLPVDGINQKRPVDAAGLLNVGTTPFEKEYAAGTGGKKDDTVALYLLEWNKGLGRREGLMEWALGLATASFILLSATVAFQMVVRLFSAGYQGISDAVISIVAMSVFGQVLVLMLGLSRQLRKNDAKGKKKADVFGSDDGVGILEEYEEEFVVEPHKDL